MLSEKAVLVSVNKNKLLFSESEPSEYFYLLKEGLIKLFKTSSSGKELTVSIISVNDYFCMPMYEEKQTYHVSALALEDSLVIKIRSNDMHSFLTSLLSETGMKIIRILCDKINDLARKLECLAFKDVEERIVDTLKEFVDRGQYMENIVTIQVTHREIASQACTVREVVSRTFSKLKEKGIVLNSGGKGITLDRDKLSLICNKQNELSDNSH